MRSEFREDAAKYYDLAPHHPNDVPFYLARLPAASASVLELGSGTGRVSIRLAHACRRVVGLDHSAAMTERARARAAHAGLGPDRLRCEVADITDFSLNETFDLIVAPFRVLQNLERDDQIRGLLDAVRSHLAPGGRCILNVFHPNRTREELIESWSSAEEQLAWQVPHEGGTLSCHDRRLRVQPSPLVLYPELVYRHVVDGALVDEATLPIAMRCYYPDDFVELIEGAGFRVTGRWGGYEGEVYGEGGELVLEFGDDRR